VKWVLFAAMLSAGCSDPPLSTSGGICVPGDATICDSSLTKVLTCHPTGSAWVLLGPESYCGAHEICSAGSAGAVCVDRLSGRVPEVLDSTTGEETGDCAPNCPDGETGDSDPPNPPSDHCVAATEFLATSTQFLELFQDGATTCNFDGACLQEMLTTNVSEINEECAGCFAELAVCAKEGECSSTCSEGLLTPSCITCLSIDATCEADFVNCSGLNGIESDDDGWLDPRDNCPHDANADQADADRDGTGDRCDDSFNPPEEAPESCTSDAECICTSCNEETGICQGDENVYPSFGCAENADCAAGEECFPSFPPASPCLNQCIPSGTPYNSCCHIHPAAGCDNEGCASSVCLEPGLDYCCKENAEDPFIWDAECAKKAKSLCVAGWGVEYTCE
jgi:hypothetical protein